MNHRFAYRPGCVALLGLLLGGWGCAQPDDVGAVRAAVGTGVLVTTVDGAGAPQPNLTVVSVDAAGVMDGWVTTDGAGHATLSLGDGDYRFGVVVGGTIFYSGAAGHCHVPACTSATIVVQGIIVVTVDDGAGHPLPGRPVAAEGAGGAFVGITSTDAHGLASFRLADGAYRFATPGSDFFFTSGAPGHCAVPGCTAATIHVSEVLVTVLDADGHPRGSQQVAAEDLGGSYLHVTSTDAEGHAIVALEPGAYRFAAPGDGIFYTSGARGHCEIPGCTRATIRMNPVCIGQPDGAACDDGDACTAIDACASGVCTGGSPVVCAAADACHDAGTCDPTTGVCSSPARPDGTACDDGSACTRTDRCLGGSCTGGDPVTCLPSPACQISGTCDGATGQCGAPGGCVPNLPPETTITAGPPDRATSPVTDGDVTFGFAASDDFSPAASLRFRWRLDDGAWQGPSPATTATLANLTEGAHRFEVAAEDEQGNVDATPAARSFARVSYATTLAGLPSATPVAGGVRVPLSGTATLLATGAPAVGVPVTVVVSLRGSRRQFSVVTGAGGAFRVDFAPLPGEAGQYTAGAKHPAVLDDPAQVTFALSGLGVDPASADQAVAPGQPLAGHLTLHNAGDTFLTGISTAITGVPAGVSVTAATVDGLDPGESAPLDYTIVASRSDGFAGQVEIQVFSAEGASVVFPIDLTVKPAVADLQASPARLDAGVLRGGQTTLELTVTNAGGAAAPPFDVVLPVVPWMTLASAQKVGPLAPGEDAKVVLVLGPPADLTLGPYTGSIGLGGLVVPFRLLVTSTAVGDVHVVAQDEFSFFDEQNGFPNVAGAKVTVTDAFTRAVAATGVTGPDGKLLLSGIVEGRYDVEVTAGQHGSFRTAVEVRTGAVEEIAAFLPRELVRYEWTVVPTTIPDEYDIKVEAVFETNVPAPVVTVEPAFVDLRKLGCQERMQIDFTLTNHGLITANKLAIDVHSSDDYLITPLVVKLGSLAAHSAFTVPVLFEGRGALCPAATAPASPAASKAATVAGGGEAIAGRFNNAGSPGGGDCRGGPRMAAQWTANCGGERAYSTGVGLQAPAKGGGGGCGHAVPGRGIGGVGFSPSFFITQPVDCNPCLTKILTTIVLDCMGLAGCTGASVGFASNCKAAFQQPSLAAAADCALSSISMAGCIGDVVGVAVLPGVRAVLKPYKCLKKIAKTIQFCGPGGLSGGSSGGSEGQGGSGSPALSLFVPRYAAQGAIASARDVPHASVVAADLARMQTYVDLLTEFYGDDIWVSATASDDDMAALDTLNNAIVLVASADSEDGRHISDRERAGLMTLPFAPPLTGADVERFVARWNRTMSYWEAGVFTAAQLPPGADPSFVDTARMAQKLDLFRAATDESIANGFESVFAQFQSDFAALSAEIEAPHEAGICARVRVGLDQKAVITRNAFKGTLNVENSGGSPLTGVSVRLAIVDDHGRPAEARCAVQGPIVSGAADLAGSGTVAPGSSVSGEWTFVPSDLAAPAGPARYTIGGTLSYVQDGVTVDVLLAPSEIDVLPNPSLRLQYFWSHDVFADDPFTPDVEPSEPFPLAVMVSNAGPGVADDVRITSSQPRIVDNDKGLLVDFKIIGSQVNTQPVSPSLAVAFGDIAPGQTAVAEWLLTSTLRGKFVDFGASYKHTSGLGDPQFSLIDGIEIHQLLHPVRVKWPADDGKPDFLVNDNLDLEHTSATVFSSTGESTLVAQLFGAAVVDGPATPAHPIVELTVPGVPAGYVYIRLDDPGAAAAGGAAGAQPLRLGRVVRSDGTEVRRYDNAWTTRRTIRFAGQTPVVESRLHIFDLASTGHYTLEYTSATGGDPAACAPPVLDGAPCDDGDRCTLNDACFGGACAGPVLLSCPAPDQCHEPGTCNRATGLCSSVTKPAGTVCNDGNGCTSADHCEDGICNGGAFRLCPAPDACHQTGACDPTVGRCINPPQPDGQSCADGLACNGGETCQGGACVARDAISCDDDNPCTAESCIEPGACNFTTVGDGTACTIGGVAGVCAGGQCTSTLRDFGLTLAPASLTIPQGGNGVAGVVVTATGGFDGPVSFGAAPPAGITAAFAPAFVTTAGGATMSVRLGAGVAPGSYAISVAATSGGTVHTATLALTVTPAGSPVYQIRSGSTAAAPPFQADQFFTGGSSATTAQAIDTSGVPAPAAAPQAVYQAQRFGDVTYTLPNLTPGAPYAVRLHFAELFLPFIGTRSFNVTINGVRALSAFDVVQAAGGQLRAVVEQLNTVADAAGRIVIQLGRVADNPIVDAIEVLTGQLVPSAPYAVRATPGDGRVSLSWQAGSGALSYNVYRGTSAGGATLYATATTAAGFTDTQAANGTAYFYAVTAVNAAGEGSASREVSATPTAGSAAIYRIRCGSNADALPFQQDQLFTGGSAAGPAGAAIDTTGVADPAPQAVYKSQRIGGMTYAFPGLVPGAPYTVRLHFAETFFTFIGSRVFDVSINGAPALSSFDVLAVTGAPNRALVEPFNVTADTGGRITIQLNRVVGDAMISGIEVLTGSVAPSTPYALRAVAGDGRVTLTWGAGAGATSYDVYRGTAAGGESLYRAGVIAAGATPTFTDDGAANGTTYFYRVAAVNGVGEGALSGEASATPGAGPVPVYRISSGSNRDAPPFQQDQLFTAGVGLSQSAATIDTSGVSDPAPVAVYQTQRFGAVAYTLPGLVPGAAYTVRLHFAETFFTFIGSRVFDVNINGAPVLSSFDILAVTGAPNRAVVEQFNATADTGGRIAIQLNRVVSDATISGIELLTGSVMPSAPYTLRAVAGAGRVTLTWGAGAGATSYNVYRGTAAGGEALYRAGVVAAGATPTFTDDGAANGTTYFYRVAAANGVGQGALSGEASAAPTTGPAPVYRIRSGSNRDAPPFQQDQLFSGGAGLAQTVVTVDTSGVSSPAPMAVYQSQRFGPMIYTLPGLVPGAAYTLRLHFAEIFFVTAGNRRFDVQVGGVTVLAGLDVFAAAGGPNRAIVQQFPVIADAGGKVAVRLVNVVGEPMINGVELLTVPAP